MWLCLPVKITARLGVQIEFVTNAASKRAPSLASRSRFGVEISLLSYALSAGTAWSSLITKMMLGAASASAGSRPKANVRINGIG